MFVFKILSYFFYQISVQSYFLLIRLVSPINSKAKLWIRGRKDIFRQLQEKLSEVDQSIWFHCSSLGEFEQGRPLIEWLKDTNPEVKIVLTFFSPSGFEIRKKYQKADFVFYLPADSKANAQKFIKIIKPKFVVFIKYEFWYHYLKTLYDKKIPVFLVSAIFRENQLFFQSYGLWFREMLSFFTHIFVQNQSSANLLSESGINNFSISGDTRFDRVIEIASHPVKFPEVEKFCDNKFIIIAGSSWKTEEEYLSEFIIKTKHDVKMIIVPHEVHESNIQRIELLFKNNCIWFSDLQNNKISDAKVLIVDSIGKLSSLYQYGAIACIGGGFEKGIHNILEAAVFGLPVIFGPKHKKFNEATELLEFNGAFSFSTFTSLETILNQLILNKKDYLNASNAAKVYVQSKKGATQKIINKILTNIKNAELKQLT